MKCMRRQERSGGLEGFQFWWNSTFTEGPPVFTAALRGLGIEDQQLACNGFPF